MDINLFDFALPEEQIAQSPSPIRDECRLMAIDREHKSFEHKKFSDILSYLKPGDVLVRNNTKVIPARLIGEKVATHGKVEVLLLKQLEGDIWEALVGNAHSVRVGSELSFGDGALTATCVEVLPEGIRHVEFHYEGIFLEILERLGKMPLPPYIERESTEEDKDMYQTVYSKIDGSVAAPTAGLHFTEELLAAAEAKGVRLAYVTLHVGIGTFRPVKCDNIEDHQMHFEEYFVDEDTAETINDTIRKGGRIISVGTTSTRTVESAAYYDETAGKYLVKPGHGNTGIFIYPGYEYKIVNALITNFHLPKSTLIMLISALYDREKILEAYREAVKEEYRFFSYGDAMLIE